MLLKERSTMASSNKSLAQMNKSGDAVCGMGLAMQTIRTFFLNYEQYIILLTICFFAGTAWRHHRLISRLFIIVASCLWVIYVYRYQIAVGWPALDASGELSLRELFSDAAFIRHWSYLLSAAALGGALGVAFDDTPRGRT